MLEGSHKGVKGRTQEFQECYNGVTKVLQECYKGVIRVQQWCYLVSKGCCIGVSFVFQ